jgi:fatty-acyl-CoA synthase
MRKKRPEPDRADCHADRQKAAANDEFGRESMTRLDPVATYALSTPARPALVDLETGRRWTYGNLHGAIDRLAAWLVEQFGPASGERAAVLSRNCSEMVILQVACVRAGMIFVPFNWRLAAAEIEALARDAEPVIIFHEADLAPPAAIARHIAIGEMLALGKAGARPPAAARRAFTDTGTLLYTSGTSGRPKGVMLSEENVFWGSANFIYGNNVNMHSVSLCDMPLFHTAGLNAATRAALQAGACTLITKGFDPERTLASLSDPALAVTHYFSVPQMAATLWNMPGFDPARLAGIFAWSIGGAPNPRAQTERFVGAGIRIAEGFGMSETGSNFGMPTHDLSVLLAKAGSCGLPFMTVDARIVDEEGNDVPDGELGELWLSGPCIADGYWKQPETTAKAFRDGWFITGDTARKDEDGFYYIVDRKKDMYISGGENVYPAEVEAAIAELTGVAESAVIGVPDARWGEVGRAYVIPVAGSSVTADDVLAHCNARLARFKVPKSVVVTDAIPRTASGKVQKHLLKARALDELGGSD